MPRRPIWGHGTPYPCTERVRVDRALRAALQRDAQALGMTVSEYIRRLIQTHYIDRLASDLTCPPFELGTRGAAS